MRFLLIVSFFGILYLVGLVTKSNPFDRSLQRKEYSIVKALSRHDCSISFKENAQLDSLRKAIFDALYQTNCSEWEYRGPSISFDNFVRWGHISNQFKPFYFSTISFENVAEDSFQCKDFLLLPCDQLILPRQLSYVDLTGYNIPYIKEIVMQSPDFVSLVPHEDFSSDPFKSAMPINFVVPKELLAKYRTDPSWASLRFLDENGVISPVTFNGLPPIDPSEKRYFIRY